MQMVGSLISWSYSQAMLYKTSAASEYRKFPYPDYWMAILPVWPAKFPVAKNKMLLFSNSGVVLCSVTILGNTQKYQVTGLVDR